MNYNFQIDNVNLKKLVLYYQQIKEENTDSRILYSFKTADYKIIVYNSNKVMFQGKKGFDEYKKWANVFGLDIENKADETIYLNQYNNKKVIGSDEVGTGDFFGPVVVCTAYLTPNDLDKFKELNIQDSKNLSDIQIKDLAKILIEKVNHHILVLNPEKYNELVDKGFNMNKIKAYLHNHAIKNMVKTHNDFDYVILDQFCSPKNYFDYLKDEDTFKNIQFHTKGESIHKAVAVASIIARYKFLLEMDKLSEMINIQLPKGAGPAVDAIAKLIFLKQGKDIFRKIAKMNFKNTKRIFIK